MIDLGGYSQQEDSINAEELGLPTSSEGVRFEGGGVSNQTSGREREFTAEEIREFSPNVDPKLNEAFMKAPLPNGWKAIRDPKLCYLNT